MTNNCFSFLFEDISGMLSLTFRRVVRADMGMYLISATNDRGSDNVTFMIMPRGEGARG